MDTQLLSILAAAMAIAVLLAPAAVRGDAAVIKAVTKCAKENDIKMEILLKACDNDMTAEPGFKCFTKCLQQVMGVMDDKGTFLPEKSASFVAEEDKAAVQELAKGCAAEVNANADLCEKASAANECMMKKDADVYKKSCMAIVNKMMA